MDQKVKQSTNLKLTLNWSSADYALSHSHVSVSVE